MDEMQLKNIYKCDKCGRQVVTIDLVMGTTPFMVPCSVFGDGGCSVGMAVSQLYPLEAQEQVAAFEWYKPEAGEMLRQSPQMREHIRKGGLLLRPVQPASA